MLSLAGPILIAAVGAVVYAVLFIGHRDRRFPHGPPTLPIIGNVHQIPKTGAHFKFTEWAKTYGGIFSLKLGPGTAIVLTDRRLVKELVDKKSTIYNHRPTNYILQDLVTQGDYLLLMNYDAEWRKFRKVIAQTFTESMCEKEHIKLQNAEAIQMMRDLVIEPKDYMLHPRRYSNSIIMSILYGFRTPTVRTEHMQRLNKMLDKFQEVTEFGATPPVDFYPFLKYIPEQFLGNWRSRAHAVHAEMIKLYSDMVNRVRERRETQGSKSSMIDRVLGSQEKLELSEHQLCFLGGVAMDGGSDTTGAAILSFMKAMTCYPKVQKLAQEEIDRHVGDSRSPTWSDYQSLPYVSGVVKEAMRWRPVGGLIPPHATAEDDWADGKFIPKGTIVIINDWGMHQDEKYYPDPDTFEPARFAGRTLLASEYAVSPEYESRDHYIYGAGRRACPGIHLAERSLFIGMAKILWAVSFEKVVDENGQTLEPDTNYATGWEEGLVTATRDFPCKVVPRSAERVKTIMREFEEAQADVFSQYE